MSLSTKSAIFFPSMISGTASYFQSGFSRIKCSYKGKLKTPAPPFSSSSFLMFGLSTFKDQSTVTGGL